MLMRSEADPAPRPASETHPVEGTSDPAAGTAAATKAEPPGRLKRWAAWGSAIVATLGVAAAGLGYLTTGAAFFSGIEDYLAGRSEARALIAVAGERLDRGDPEAAWRLVTQARAKAPQNVEAAAMQRRIGFRWLESLEPPEPSDMEAEKAALALGAVAGPVRDVLLDQVGTLHGRQKADTEAHIGWADYLRSTGEKSAAGVRETFDAAIAEDSGNFYAHLMRGYWQVMHGEPVQAQADFDAALRNDQDDAYAQRMILLAWLDHGGEAEALRAANDWRLSHRPMSGDLKRAVNLIYGNALMRDDLIGSIEEALPPREQIALLDWLRLPDFPPDEQEAITYFTARFVELDGRKAEALQLYQRLIKASATPDSDTFALHAVQALARLQPQSPH